MANLEIAVTMAIIGAEAVFAYLYVKTEEGYPLKLLYLSFCSIFIMLSFYFGMLFADAAGETAIYDALTPLYQATQILSLIIFAFWFLKAVVMAFEIFQVKWDAYTHRVVD